MRQRDEEEGLTDKLLEPKPEVREKHISTREITINKRQ